MPNTDASVYRLMLSSATMVGRMYGQATEDERLFDIALSDDHQPVIMIRHRDLTTPPLILPAGAILLVQLFERPDVLWLARPTRLRGEPMVMYIPLQPLAAQSAWDDPSIPVLAEVTLEQVAEGVTDAMDHLDPL